jgi:hypothetical protein
MVFFIFLLATSFFIVFAIFIGCFLDFSSEGSFAGFFSASSESGAKSGEIEWLERLIGGMFENLY